MSPKSARGTTAHFNIHNSSVSAKEGGAANVNESLNNTITVESVMNTNDSDGKNSKMKDGSKENQFKLLKGSVSMDSIPLNWGKHPIIGSILRILQLCIGPYGINNNFSEVDTSKVFKDIHLIACEKYHSLFGEYDTNFSREENFNTNNNTLIRQPDGTKAF